MIVKQDGPVLKVTLNRPEKLNAINAEMFTGLVGAAEEASSNPSIRAVIFTGAGKAFCTGGDIGGMRRPNWEENSAGLQQVFRQLQSVFEKIEAIPVPTVAAVHGHCLGAGLQLVLMCDFRVAASGSLLGLPDVKNGIIPGLGATIRLPHLIGLSRSVEMIMTGDAVTAEEALEMGLVNKVVPPAKLGGTAFELAGKLLQRAPLALAAAKKLLYTRAGWEEIAATQVRLMGSEDAKEGRAAFLEKRSPVYKGR